MSERRRSRWQRYVRKLADQLGLRDWNISVKTEPCSDSSYAEVTFMMAKDLAEVNLCAEWESLAPEQQRESIIHELIHLHQADSQRVVIQEVEQATTARSSAIIYAAHNRAIERAADHMARAIAPFYPLP